jgi:hypothetical protein
MTVNPVNYTPAVPDPRPRCAWCQAVRPAEMLEPMNVSGALACKAGAACEMRQAGKDPAAELGALLRAVRAELSALTTRELAELQYELRGPYPHDWADGFVGSLRIQLGGRGDSAEASAAVAAERLARKRRRAALKGAATRAARKAETS